MHIQTLQADYQVICRLEGAPECRTYLCSREDEPGKEFIVQGVLDPALREKLPVFFLELSAEKNIPEFVESFVWDGGVWSIFSCEKGTPWTEWTKQKMPFEERLDAASGLMAHIFAAQLPVYLQYEASNPQNIVRSRHSGVCIHYLLREPRRLHTDLQADLYADLQKRTALCLEGLLKKACESAPEEPAEFLERLQRAEFQSDGEVYYAYRRLEETLRLAKTEGRLEKKNVLPTLWKRLFAQREHIAQFLYCLVIGVLCGVFAYVCVVPQLASGEQVPFHSIGTLQIIDYGPVPEPEIEMEDPVSESEIETEDPVSEPEIETELQEETETTEHPRELG